MFKEANRLFRTLATTFVVGGMLTASNPVRNPSHEAARTNSYPKPEHVFTPTPTVRPTRTPIPTPTDFYQDSVYVSLRLCKARILDDICEDNERGIVGADISIYQSPPGIQVSSATPEKRQKTDSIGRALLSYTAKVGEVMHLTYPPYVYEIGKRNAKIKFCASDPYVRQNTHNTKSLDLEYSPEACDMKPGEPG